MRVSIYRQGRQLADSIRRASWLPLLPLLLGLSIVLLVIVPASVAARWIPICGAVALALEALCLLRLAAQLRRAFFAQVGPRSRLGPAPLQRLRRRLLPLLNGLAGTAVVAIGFVPMAIPMLAQGSSSSAARLLWLLTGGGLFVAIALSELTSFVLTALCPSNVASNAGSASDIDADIGSTTAA